MKRRRLQALSIHTRRGMGNMLKRANQLLATASDWIRTVLLAAATNEMLFFFAAFLLPAVLNTELFRWYPEQVEAYGSMIVVPWGMALCLYRLGRRSGICGEAQRADIAVLFVLLGWIVVPFWIRYGLTESNVSSWVGHATVYFALYAMTSEESSKRREELFDQVCAMLCALSLLLGGALLWCAWNSAWIDADWVVHYGACAGDRFRFGVYQLSQLCDGKHYNNTGMTALCCAMFCLAGAQRGKKVWTRALHLAAAVAMMIVIVLTQSRTARYALIAALGVGVYGRLAASRRIPHVLIRHAVSLLLAVVFMAASYVGASKLTDAALVHYAEHGQGVHSSIIRGAVAQEEEETQEAAVQNEAAEGEGAAVQPMKARGAGDRTFTARTTIWGGLIEFWKQNPKYMIIGMGADRVGWLVADLLDWPVYGLLSMHNAYLQFMGDYGAIGMALLVAFLLTVAPSVLRVFFAAGEKRKPGYNAMCMLVVGILLTGLMENQPLLSMTEINMSLFVALALLAARGNELKREN